MAFYLMLSPCGAAYSLDARRAARRRGTAGRAPDRPLGAAPDPAPALPDLLQHRRAQVQRRDLARTARRCTTS